MPRFRRYRRRRYFKRRSFGRSSYYGRRMRTGSKRRRYSRRPGVTALRLVRDVIRNREYKQDHFIGLTALTTETPFVYHVLGSNIGGGDAINERTGSTFKMENVRISAVIQADLSLLASVYQPIRWGVCYVRKPDNIGIALTMNEVFEITISDERDLMISPISRAHTSNERVLTFLKTGNQMVSKYNTDGTDSATGGPRYYAKQFFRFKPKMKTTVLTGGTAAGEAINNYGKGCYVVWWAMQGQTTVATSTARVEFSAYTFFSDS